MFIEPRHEELSADPNYKHLAPNGAKTGAATRQRLDAIISIAGRLEGASGTLALQSVR